MFQAVETADVARKGPADLEKGVDGIRNYFFKDGVQMVADGYSLEETTEIMETRIEYREKEKNTTDMLKSLATLLPLGDGRYIDWFGFGGWFGGEGADNLGGGMAAALITTLYGVALQICFLPMAQKWAIKPLKHLCQQHC